MSKTYYLLRQDSMGSEIDIHEDLLSILPSSLSRKRALKIGSEIQEEMEDFENGAKDCILCDPDRRKPAGSSRLVEWIPNRVAAFENDFPYLPGDQHVVFLWHNNPKIREEYLHRFKLKDFGRRELYWLLKGCTQRAKKYKIPNENYDLMRTVLGFNLGKLAGQSLPHFHAQYGWEVVLNRRLITKAALELYFSELNGKQLILYEDERIKVVVPWTPKGQFAIELYYVGKYDISELDDPRIKIFACVGSRLVEKYLSLNIQNLNIVFWNSPHGRKVEPLIAHFVPRVNMPALYEIRGVNVVDTPPETIAEEFKKTSSRNGVVIDWAKIINNVEEYNPDKDFEESLKPRRKNGKSKRVSASKANKTRKK